MPQDEPEPEPSPDCIHETDHGVDSVSLAVYFLECNGERIPGSKDMKQVPVGCRIHFNATPRDGSGAPTCSRTWPVWQVGPEELVAGNGGQTFTPAYTTKAPGVMSARCIVDGVRSGWIVLTITEPLIRRPPGEPMPAPTTDRHGLSVHRAGRAGRAPSACAADAATPSQFLGFTVGADRTLADYRQIASYFRALDAASPRVAVQVLGKTTLGEDMLMAVISSEANLGNLPRLKEIARRIADPRGPLGRGGGQRWSSEGKRDRPRHLQHPLDRDRRLARWRWSGRTRSPPRRTRRRGGGSTRSCVLLVPSLNPDGQIMETEWYRKNLGTALRGRAGCPGSTTTTSATTTTATGSCSRRRRRGP